MTIDEDIKENRRMITEILQRLTKVETDLCNHLKHITQKSEKATFWKGVAITLAAAGVGYFLAIILKLI